LLGSWPRPSHAIGRRSCAGATAHPSSAVQKVSKMKPRRIMPDPKFDAQCASFRTGNLHRVGQMELKANDWPAWPRNERAIRITLREQ
jgi:hypothetical protein